MPRLTWPIMLGCFAVILIAVSASTISRVTAVPTPQRAGDARIDLGVRPASFGSKGQAAELLTLIDQQPGLATYRITYRTEVDTVVFGCNLVSGELTRSHIWDGNHGSSETWQGYPIERLKSAAGDGSLNDTPAGKQLAKTTNF